jgi:hypothetical protein
MSFFSSYVNKVIFILWCSGTLKGLAPKNGHKKLNNQKPFISFMA